MTRKHITKGMLLVAGLLFAGCGGVDVEVEAEEGPTLQTREDRIDCAAFGMVWRQTYYSDATYSDVVGVRLCDCYGTDLWGTRTQFIIDDFGTCHWCPSSMNARARQPEELDFFPHVKLLDSGRARR